MSCVPFVVLPVREEVLLDLEGGVVEEGRGEGDRDGEADGGQEDRLPRRDLTLCRLHNEPVPRRENSNEIIWFWGSFLRDQVPPKP